MQNHASTVWRQYVDKSSFKNLLVLAHSAGGGCVSRLMMDFPESFFGKVKQLAYTDSWVIDKSELPKEYHRFMEERAVHYVASSLPLGSQESGSTTICQHVSAGHSKHEYTTGKAWPMIMF